MNPKTKAKSSLALEAEDSSKRLKWSNDEKAFLLDLALSG